MLAQSRATACAAHFVRRLKQFDSLTGVSTSVIGSIFAGRQGCGVLERAKSCTSVSSHGPRDKGTGYVLALAAARPHRRIQRRRTEWFAPLTRGKAGISSLRTRSTNFLSRSPLSPRQIYLSHQFVVCLIVKDSTPGSFGSSTTSIHTLSRCMLTWQLKKKALSPTVSVRICVKREFMLSHFVLKRIELTSYG